MNEKLAIALGLIGLVLVGAGAYASYQWQEESSRALIPEPYVAPQEPVASSTALPYGKVTLRLKEQAVFEGISIRPVEIVEDSRCPMNARCIQAGTVRLRLEVVSGSGTSSNVIELGKSVTTEAERVTLLSVEPSKMAGELLESDAYRFSFSVEKRTDAATPAPVGKCYVGGCSSQLCSDQPDMVSTCEYREQYACYKTARCERQPTGACGWTMTNSLKMCLEST